MSVISRKNQVTVPVDVLRAAGLEPGDDVRIKAVGPGRLDGLRREWP
jgi:bifunctional DNA-binding transcriptional regulator/antitoxin component of YhaV-PrlF toxin-antitoxin module